MMAKRVLDGEGLWRGDKLSRVEPTRYRSEYANLLPLALANGAFEANPRRIWSTVYSYNRPDVSPEEVEQILAEFEAVRLLFRWTEPETGKVWGYWVGIDKPGRLPGRSRRGRNEAVGPEPPAQELRRFMDSNGVHNLPNGNEELPGFGSGSGINPSSETKSCSDGVKTSNQTNTSSTRTKKPSNGAYGPFGSEIYAVYPRQVGKDAALKAIEKAIHKIAAGGATGKHPDFKKDAAAAGWLKARVSLYRNSPLGSRPDKEYIPHPSTWMNAGRYEDDEQEWNRVPGLPKGDVGPPPLVTLPDSYIPASERIREERKTQGKKQNE